MPEPMAESIAPLLVMLLLPLLLVGLLALFIRSQKGKGPKKNGT